MFFSESSPNFSVNYFYLKVFLKEAQCPKYHFATKIKGFYHENKDDLDPIWCTQDPGETTRLAQTCRIQRQISVEPSFHSKWCEWRKLSPKVFPYGTLVGICGGRGVVPDSIQIGETFRWRWANQRCGRERVLSGKGRRQSKSGKSGKNSKRS